MKTDNPIRVVIIAAGMGTRMKAKLPKALIKVHGKPMITHIYEKVLRLNPGKIIIVVGYKKQLVMETIGEGASYAVQNERLGTGHAVLCARDELLDFHGNVVVLNGDMPFINIDIVRQLMVTREKHNAAASIVSAVMENPPDCGRIIRDKSGRIKKIVETWDATPEQLAIREISVGTYCFDCQPLLNALVKLDNKNARAEYYLPGVIAILSSQGLTTVTIQVQEIGDIFNINTPRDVRFFETLRYD